MSVIGSNILAGASGSAVTEFRIERSLRFNDDDDAYLNRTPSSAGNRRTMTWSGWVKRSNGSQKGIFSSYAGTHPTTALIFSSSDEFWFFNYTSSYNFELKTSAQFRDFSAWFHFVVAVDTTQATASNRVKIYINGEQITAFSTSTYPSQNFDLDWNSTTQHYIGRHTNTLGGYLADFHFVDGQQLAATDFGEYDDDNVWQPKKYSGTYGANGFHLDFSDNTSTTTVAEDSSGNGNDWTANNISVASGAGNDSLIDSPTNYEADSSNNGGNYATLNALVPPDNYALSEGNLEVAGTGTAGYRTIYSTIGVSSGKWYFEAKITALGNWGFIGAANSLFRDSFIGNAVGAYGYEWYYGRTYSGNATSNTGYGTYTTNDVLAVALDLDNGKIYWAKNGTWLGSSDPAAGTNPGYTGLTDGPYFFGVSTGTTSGGLNTTWEVNFGQRPFAYTPPAGFESLCTTNLSDPTIADGSTVMDAVLWSGDGVSGRDITGLSFAPDLVWIKRRNSGIYWNVLFDSIRGGEQLSSNETDAGLAPASNVAGYVSAYNSDGFELTAGNSTIASVNATGGTYVGWSWDGGTSTVSNTDGTITSSVRANSSAGFSIVSWSGSGSNATIGHGLNAAPYFITAKCRNAAPTTWLSYHNLLGATKYIELNNTNAAATASTVWNNTDPTSSVFSVGTSSGINQSGRTYIAYCFAPVEGYSSFGSYIGNGSTTDEPFVYTGFRPRWLMIKATTGSTSTDYWFIWDTARETYNEQNTVLYANSSLYEGSASTAGMDMLSNGFKLRCGNYAGINQSGTEYLYMAFAEHPFKTARAR
jgi:hypothetical protein